MSVSILIENLDLLAGGLWMTIQLTALSLLIGLILSVPLALTRSAGIRIVSEMTRLFVFVFRGTPLLVQIFVIYYGFGQFDWLRESVLWRFFKEAYFCALLALTLNTTAYTIEIFRGAIDSIPRGVKDAAIALGLPKWTTLREITLPLMFQRVIPAYGNEVILMLQASSLVSVITLVDLTGAARIINSKYYSPVEAFGAIAVIYLILTLAITQSFKRIEARLSRSK